MILYKNNVIFIEKFLTVMILKKVENNLVNITYKDLFNQI